MDVTLDTAAAAAGTTDAPAPFASQTTLRMDWILTALSVWLVGGSYVDLWALAQGRVDNAFFTSASTT